MAKRKRIKKFRARNLNKNLNKNTKIKEQDYIKAFVKLVEMGNTIVDPMHFPAYSRYIDLFKEQYKSFIGNGEVLNVIKQTVKEKCHKKLINN